MTSKRSQLQLERLESKVSPAVYTWQGTFSDNWMTPSNWNRNDGTIPGAGDTVLLTTLPAGGQSPRVPATRGVRCASLTFQNTFNGTGLTIDGTLTVSSVLYWRGADKPISGLGELDLVGADMWWGNGTLAVNTIGIYGGSLKVIGGARNLLVNQLYVGGAVSTGRLVVSPTSDPLTGYLTLGSSTTITVSSNGIIDFQAGANSDTCGGISPGTTTNRILNAGTIWFSQQDTAGATLGIGVGITNTADTSLLQFGSLLATVSVHFNDSAGGYDSLWQQKGRTAIQGGSTVELDNDYWQDAGTLTISAADSAQSRMIANLYIYGGILDMDPAAVAGDFQTLYVAGLYMYGGTLKINLDGRYSGVCDQIQATGNVVIGQSGSVTTLQLNTVGGAAVAGNVWDILQSDDYGCSGLDFDFFAWTGAADGPYNHSISPVSYQLSI